MEVNSSVGTRYIRWRCLMWNECWYSWKFMLMAENWVEMLVSGIRNIWLCFNCIDYVNSNVPSFRCNNVQYWYAATSPPPPTTIGSIRIRCTDVIVVRRRCRSSRPIRWSHDKNRELQITNHIERHSVRVVRVTICTIEYMSETNRIITDLYLRY